MFATFSTVANLRNLTLFSERLFYEIQQTHIFPSVTSCYKQNQIRITELLRDWGPLLLSGDGCCDSPGYSAKYDTNSGACIIQLVYKPESSINRQAN